MNMHGGCMHTVGRTDPGVVPSFDAVVLLCHRVDDSWLNFLNDFKLYDVYVVVDNDDYDDTRARSLFPNVRFVKHPAIVCASSGYKELCFTELMAYTSKNVVQHRPVSAWEKAMYHFCVIMYGVYGNVWFFEDDVFFHSELTLLSIDKRCRGTADLVSPPCEVNGTGDMVHWHWPQLVPDIEFPLPYLRGMMCAMRLSRRMIAEIREYVSNHGTFFFMEAFFPTLCHHAGLVHEQPEELNTVTYSDRPHSVDMTHVYHPLKGSWYHVDARATMMGRELERMCSFLPR